MAPKGKKRAGSAPSPSDEQAKYGKGGSSGGDSSGLAKALSDKIKGGAATANSKSGRHKPAAQRGDKSGETKRSTCELYSISGKIVRFLLYLISVCFIFGICDRLNINSCFSKTQ